MATVTGSQPPSGQQPPAPEDAGIAGSVTGQWAEIYPPDAGEPELAPDRSERADVSPLAALATVLFGATAVLVVASSFMPLFQVSQSLGPAAAAPGITSTVSMDAWHLTQGDSLSSHVSAAPVPVGYPMVVAALLAVVVVVLRLRAGRQPAGERLANALGIAAAAFVTGLVFAIGMFEVAWRGLSSSAAAGLLDATVGAGYWLLLTAALVSILASIVAYRRPIAPADDYDDEADDSIGMAIVDPPVEADPAVPPGQPAEWPVVAVIPNDERTNW